MKIKIDRKTPLLKQLLVTDQEEPKLGIWKVKGLDSRSVKLEEIEINNIFFSEYLDLDGNIRNWERVEYFKKHSRKFIRLDAAIGLALVKNGYQIPENWGKNERGNPVSTFTFDGTAIIDDHGNTHYLTVSRDVESGEWHWGLQHKNDESGHPSAVLKLS